MAFSLLSTLRVLDESYLINEHYYTIIIIVLSFCVQPLRTVSACCTSCSLIYFL